MIDVRSQLEVAKNLPLGENCKCLTSAECATKSCVASKLLSLGMREATLDPLGVVVTPVSDITLDESVNADEVVRFRAGEENGLLGEDVADWSIMTDRMALVKRSRGVIGEFDVSLKVVVGDSKLGCEEPSALKCKWESVDCRMGDSRERGSGERDIA